jgi:hypothetical protein
MERFWKLLEQSTIISGTLALVIVGAVVYLAVTGQVIPDLLGQALLIVISFFFGTKVGTITTQDSINREINSLREEFNYGRHQGYGESEAKQNGANGPDSGRVHGVGSNRPGGDWCN